VHVCYCSGADLPLINIGSMELYSIGDEEETPGAGLKAGDIETSKRHLHPAFLSSSLPIHHLPKGSQSSYLGPPLHYSLQLTHKSFLRRLLSSSSTEWQPRVLKLQEEFLYVYERIQQVWTLRGVYDLTRLINLEVGNGSEITLVFPNASLNPVDPLKKKTFQMSDLPSFFDYLRNHLSKVNIDFDFVPKLAN